MPKPSAREAWYALYHERVDEEREYERETGLCSACGDPLATGDHDEDSEEAQELGRLARAEYEGHTILPTIDGTAHHEYRVIRINDEFHFGHKPLSERAERIVRRAIARPLNWDDMGASARDLWEERIDR